MDDQNQNSVTEKIAYDAGVVFDLAKWLILGLVVFVIVNSFFFSIFVVSGASMDPSLKDKDWIFWNKNTYSENAPARGDIVVVSYPGDPKHKTYVKRIVGLPGEKIEIKDEKVYIDDVLLSESYLGHFVYTDAAKALTGVWELKSGQYFVMGDNRPGSNDSRYFGPVDKKFVLGKAVVRIFPGFRLTSDI